MSANNLTVIKRKSGSEELCDKCGNKVISREVREGIENVPKSAEDFKLTIAGNSICELMC